MTPTSFALSAATAASFTKSARPTGAAKDFEGLLIGQILKSAHEQNSGWLGGEEDESGETALGLGEQYLAGAIAAAGGLGLSPIIERGLAQPRTGTDKTPGISVQD